MLWKFRPRLRDRHFARRQINHRPRLEALEERVVPHLGEEKAFLASLDPSVIASVVSPQDVQQNGWMSSADIQLDNSAAAAAGVAPAGAGLSAPPGAGAAVAPAGSTDPALIGQWGKVFALPFETVASSLLPTGDVFTFAYNPNSLVLYDPLTNVFSTPAPILGYNPFCGTVSLLADGTLFTAGGAVPGLRSGGTAGAANASIYNPFSDSWTSLPNMNNLRWYPSSVTLPNGDVLVDSGLINGTEGRDTLPQVFQVKSGTWRDLVTAQRDEDLFPRIFIAPDGRVVDVGPDQDTYFLDTTGTGEWTEGPANNYGERYKGSAVMYEPGKILLVGGSQKDTNSENDKNVPTATAETLDLTQPNATWQYTSPMAFARKNFTATIMADGEILVAGGTSGVGKNNTVTPVYPAEIWNPETGQWSMVASLDVPRWYHSTSLLLPDGSILASGGVGLPSAQIYYPPYLFRGARPTITNAPNWIGYGQNFFVQTPDTDITDVHLIRLGSATHGFNFDQSFQELSFTPVAGGLQVTAPDNATTATPGYYMMFLFNSRGVPAVAKIIQVGQTPAAPGSLIAQPAGGLGIALYWTDNSSNESGFRIESSADGTSFAPLGTTNANVTYYADPTGTAGTFYRVIAFNDAGDSAASNMAQAIFYPNVLPAAPTGLMASSPSNSKTALSWTDNANNETGFAIDRSTDGVTFSTIAVVGANVTSYLDTGLTGGSTWTYQVRAVNDAGSSGASAPLTWTTPNTSAPAPASNLTATVVTPTTITLAWDNNAINSDGFSIERSTDGINYVPLAVADPYEKRYADIGLPTWTTLFYRLTTFNGAGASTPVAVVADFPTTVPADPTNLSVVTFDLGLAVPGQVHTAEATLTWVSNSVAPNVEEGFSIERSDDNGTTFAQIATVGAGTTTLTDTNLAGDTTYIYRVRAFNINGYSQYTNTFTAITPASIPLKPTNLVVTAASATELDLAWSEDTETDVVFIVQMSLKNQHDWNQIALVYPDENGNILSYQVTGLNPNQRYYFRLQAANDTGHSTTTPVKNGTTLPADPSNLVAAGYSASQIDLGWTNNSSADGVMIERSADGGATFTQIGTVGPGVNFYADQANLSAGASYTYRVRAYNVSGTSNYSSSVGAVAVATVPLAPTGLVAVGFSTSQINLQWTNQAVNADTIEIKRSTDGIHFTSLATVAGTVTSYADTKTLTANATYYYRVRAVNSAGQSSYSNVANTTAAIGTPLAPTSLTATGINGSQINLAWINQAGNADGVIIERSADGVNFAQIAEVDATATAYQDTNGLTAKAKYYYRIRAVNIGGSSAYSNTASAKAAATLPAKPTNLAAKALSDNEVLLTWSENTNEDGFYIFQSQDNVHFTRIATTGADITSFNVTGLQAATKYYFKVRAFNSGGQSAFSNTTFATTFYLTGPGQLAPGNAGGHDPLIANDNQSPSAPRQHGIGDSLGTGPEDENMPHGKKDRRGRH
jgi:titin